MTLVTRRSGTVMNSDTLSHAMTAGFRITGIESVFLDIILSIRGVNPEEGLRR